MQQCGRIHGHGIGLGVMHRLIGRAGAPHPPLSVVCAWGGHGLSFGLSMGFSMRASRARTVWQPVPTSVDGLAARPYRLGAGRVGKDLAGCLFFGNIVVL